MFKFKAEKTKIKELGTIPLKPVHLNNHNDYFKTMKISFSQSIGEEQSKKQQRDKIYFLNKEFNQKMEVKLNK